MFPIQGSNLNLLHCGPFPSELPGKPSAVGLPDSTALAPLHQRTVTSPEKSQRPHYGGKSPVGSEERQGWNPNLASHSSYLGALLNFRASVSSAVRGGRGEVRLNCLAAFLQRQHCCVWLGSPALFSLPQIVHSGAKEVEAVKPLPSLFKSLFNYLYN